MSPTTANTDLNRVLETLGDLPSSPAIVSAVIGMATDLNTDLKELGRVLSADQGLTAKVLRLSNSSFYGRAKQIATVDEAIITLGYYTLRSLVVASSTHSLFKQKDLTRFLPMLWDHSLATAVAARQLGRQVQHAQTEEAFICGLLHDVGKLVLTQKLQTEYTGIREAAMVDGDWCVHESAKLGFTHIDVGVALLEQWNFPRELVEAVALHHAAPDAAPDRPPTLAQIIWLANSMANRLGSSQRDTVEPPWPERFARASFNWETDRIAVFFSTFEEQLAQERWLFSEST
jgi:putative nucleotidyltransferase with HDIG domain